MGGCGGRGGRSREGCAKDSMEGPRASEAEQSGHCPATCPGEMRQTRGCWPHCTRAQGTATAEELRLRPAPRAYALRLRPAPALRARHLPGRLPPGAEGKPGPTRMGPGDPPPTDSCPHPTASSPAHVRTRTHSTNTGVHICARLHTGVHRHVRTLLHRDGLQLQADQEAVGGAQDPGHLPAV